MQKYGFLRYRYTVLQNGITAMKYLLIVNILAEACLVSDSRAVSYLAQQLKEALSIPYGTKSYFDGTYSLLSVGHIISKVG